MMESAPLLGNARSNEPDHDDHATRLETLQQRFAKWRTSYICVMFLIVTDVPSFMGEGPMLRMLELGAYREHYSAHDPDTIDRHGNISERLCKLPEIQSRVARIRGLLARLEAVPGLLLAVPYGIVADTYGSGGWLVPRGLSDSRHLDVCLPLFLHCVSSQCRVFCANEGRHWGRINRHWPHALRHHSCVYTAGIEVLYTFPLNKWIRY